MSLWIVIMSETVFGADNNDQADVTIPSGVDASSLAWNFQTLYKLPFEASGGTRTTGHVILFDTCQTSDALACVIANNWLPDDTLTAFVFYRDYQRRKAVSHFNIATSHVSSHYEFDYDLDGSCDLAFTCIHNDTSWLHIMNASNRKLLRRPIATGADRDHNGTWDGWTNILGVVDLNGNGHRQMLLATDVGYDLYPRELMCLSLEPDSVMWQVPVSGIISNDSWSLINVTPSEQKILVGITSKGNAATAPDMDDGHSYFMLVAADGKREHLQEVGGVFSQSRPIPFDYGLDGSDEILVPVLRPLPDSQQEECLLVVYTPDGKALDSMSLGVGTIVKAAICLRNKEGARAEVVMSLTNGHIIIVDHTLTIKQSCSFYTDSRLWYAGNFIGDEHIEFLVNTKDNALWLLDDELKPLALLQVDGQPDLSRTVFNRDETGRIATIWVATDRGRQIACYKMGESHWTTVFSRHPSLAFWLAFIPMALILVIVTVFGYRARRQNKIILKQKNELDAALSSLNEAQKELVAIEKFRKAKEALLASEQRFRELAELLPQTIFECALDGRITFSNLSGFKSSGFSPEDMGNGVYVSNFIIDKDGRDIKQILSARASGKPVDTNEYIVRRKNGSTYPTLIYSSPIIQNGKPVGLRGISIDITERKEAELALQESEERYRNLVESAGGPVFSVDRDGTFLLMNSIAAKHAGGIPTDFVGKTMHDLFPSQIADRQRQTVQRVFDTGSGETVEAVTHLQGQPHHFRTNLQPVRDGSGTVVAVLGISSDIGHLINITNELKAERDFIRSLLNTANSMIVCYDNKDEITIFNIEAEHLTGLSEPQVLGRTWTEACPAISATNSGRGHSRFENWLHNDSDVLFEGSFTTNDGVVRTILWSKSVLKTEGIHTGQITITVGQDVTERVTAAQALRESEERYRAVWESSAHPISLTDAEGRLQFVNPAYCQLFGYTEEELLGEYIFDKVIPETMREQVKNRHHEVMQTAEPFSADEIRLIDKSGNDVWVQISIGFITLQKDSRFMVSVLTDIRSHHDAKNALRESEERFRSIATATPFGIAITRLSDGKFIYTNEAGAETFRCELDEVIDMESSSFYADTAEHDQIMLEIKEGKTITNREVHVKRLDGKLFWGLMSVRPITLDGEAALFVSMVDITKLKDAQKRLQDARQEQYDQVKRMAGSLAHEIYNALFPATSSIYKLGERLDLTDPEKISRNRKLLEISSLSVARAIDMTGLVKQYSRLETEKKLEPVSLRKLIEEVMGANFENLYHWEISVQIEIDKTIFIQMNRLHAFILFNNLMTNAITALIKMEKREIIIGADLLKNGLRIRFSDTGPGIPKTDHDKVFKAFYSTDPTGGTGLGLAMVKKIAELYKGEITLTDRVDKGTEFVIFLPLEIKSNIED